MRITTVERLVRSRRYAINYRRDGAKRTVTGQYLGRLGDNLWIRTLLRDYSITVSEFQAASTLAGSSAPASQAARSSGKEVAANYRGVE